MTLLDGKSWTYFGWRLVVIESDGICTDPLGTWNGCVTPSPSAAYEFPEYLRPGGRDTSSPAGRDGSGFVMEKRMRTAAA